MNVEPVDPRDQTEGVDAPRYRVYFWHGSHSEEYEVTGADVHEVLAWANLSAAGRTYSLWACLPANDEAGVKLVRLAGWDPPAGDVERPDHAVTVPASGNAQVPLQSPRSAADIGSWNRHSGPMGFRPILFSVAVFFLVSVILSAAGDMGSWELAMAVGLAAVAGIWRSRRGRKNTDESTAR